MNCDFTPRQIVERLDQFIVGQGTRSRCHRNCNRWRRQQLADEMRREVSRE